MPQPARIPRKVPGKSRVKAEAKKAWRAEDHLANVRATRLCAATHWQGPVEVHHLKQGMDRGMSLRSEGRYTIPLRHDVHMAAEASGATEDFLMREYGIDARALADALWAKRKTPEAMWATVSRHYWDAQLRKGRAP